MQVITQVKDRLIIALDTSSEKEALSLVEKLKNHVGFFKVGLELFCACGPKIITHIKDIGNKVFFDGKFLDIPNTISGAVKNMVKHRVDLLNVYMSGGADMLKAARSALLEAAIQCNLKPPKLLGVTVLTSLNNNILEKDLKIKTQIDEYVLHLAELAIKNNLDGIVCSPNEARSIREKTNKDFLIVTPGVRPAWADAQDQKRTSTPKEAIANGASHIVIGRPVTSAKDPLEATKKILDEISAVS